MQTHGLEMLDVENLRRHYHLTLKQWSENFDANWLKINDSDPIRFDEKFRRRWRLFLWTCSENFNTDNVGIGLYQITFGKQATKDYPMSRNFLYEKPIEPKATKFR